MVCIELTTDLDPRLKIEDVRATFDAALTFESCIQDLIYFQSK